MSLVADYWMDIAKEERVVAVDEEHRIVDVEKELRVTTVDREHRIVFVERG